MRDDAGWIRRDESVNTIYARRLWLLFRWDLFSAAVLIGACVAGFWALDFAAWLCRAEGWCA